MVPDGLLQGWEVGFGAIWGNVFTEFHEWADIRNTIDWFLQTEIENHILKFLDETEGGRIRLFCSSEYWDEMNSIFEKYGRAHDE